jgi:hypothetical protein
MAPMSRTQRRDYHAKQRRSQKYRERFQREHARAQRHLEALEQALVDVAVAKTAAVAAPRAGSPGDLVAPGLGQEPGHTQSLAMDLGGQ